MLVSKAQYNTDMDYQRRLCDAYRDALEEANIANERLTEELRQATVDLLVAQNENARLTKQLDLLRGNHDVC